MTSPSLRFACLPFAVTAIFACSFIVGTARAADEPGKRSEVDRCAALDLYLADPEVDLLVRADRIDASDPENPIVLETFDLWDDSLRHESVGSPGVFDYGWSAPPRRSVGDYYYGWWGSHPEPADSTVAQDSRWFWWPEPDQRSPLQGELHITGYATYLFLESQDELTFVALEEQVLHPFFSGVRVTLLDVSERSGAAIPIPTLGWAIEHRSSPHRAPQIVFWVRIAGEAGGTQNVPDGLVFLQREPEQELRDGDVVCTIHLDPSIE